MIHPANFESKIGFDSIREQIATRCTMPSSRALLMEQGFLTSAKAIESKILLTSQMRDMLMMEREFPSSEYADSAPLVAKMAVEGVFLSVDEVALLRRALSAVSGVVDFILSKREGGLYPDLVELSSSVETLHDVQRQIDNVLDKFNKVKDSASAELAMIRRQIREREGQVSRRLQQILQSAKGSGIVESDAQIAIRDGRAVIPVVAGNKRKMQGFIQDESATGKTVYIEPMEVVNLNNELRELEYSERREIVKILTLLTEHIRPYSGQIAHSNGYLSQVEMICAKARWAIENGAVKPIISDQGRLVLRQARHPLLEQSLKSLSKPIVPLNLELDKQKHILVISGPNAGGKSVCLKTTGIIQYMFQCGFLVPVGENSELPIFQSISIDIGDEQSIDNDLSTYSSHLRNMRSMLSLASSESLILIDEFGSGTEPVIGGAIAEAILDRLLMKGCYGVITTHYSNIKYYASQTAGIANGAMSFDVQNIRPLFMLEMGKPGSSFAIEIARKMGLPEDIIRSASDKAGSDHINIEKQLREIARDKRYWEQKRDRIRVTDRKVDELEQSYSDSLAKIRAERNEIIRRAKAEAAQLIADAKSQIENTIKGIREAQAEKETTRTLRRGFEEFKKEVESIDDESSDEIARQMERLRRRRLRREERSASRDKEQIKEAVAIKAAPEPVKVGAKVKIEGQEIMGEVKSIKGKKAQVAFGHILTTVNVESLRVVSSREFKNASKLDAPRSVVSVDVSQRRLNFKDNIDVRGMRSLDALEAVQSFIDDSLMVGISSVAILHGKGTGALKEEIRRYLRTIPDVKRAVDAHADRGGSGITVVEFDQD